MIERMRKHHTKTKGDIGLAQAIADLTAKGWGVLLPLTEHESFDLVAYREGRFLRVQVKYRTAVDGAIVVRLATTWADRHGVHTVPMDLAAIDLLCLYCPDTHACYYLDPRALTCKRVHLRVTPPRNYQIKGIAWARDFVDIPASVLGIPAVSPSALERKPFVGQSSEPGNRFWFLSARSSIG